MKKLFARIEHLHNKASDTRFVWFPFLFLKPRPHQKITFLRYLGMSFCFGFYFSIISSIRYWAWDEKHSLNRFLFDFIFWTFIFAIWFGVVTVYFWNKRARSLLTTENKTEPQ